MKRPVVFRAVSVLTLALGLAACKAGPVDTSRAGFKANYLVARVALETGQYEKATRHYASLLRTSGPLEPRLRLEYAHALLREGKYDKAADEAGEVAGQLSGAGRSAALAVVGTARHEAARVAIRKGRTGLAEVNLLKSARAALREMMARNPELDTTGGMAARLADIDIELQAIL